MDQEASKDQAADGLIPLLFGEQAVTVMKRRILVGLGMAVVLAVAWFACVDWSWFVEICPDCGYGNDVAQYRVCGLVVYEEAPTPYHTIAEQVSRDLGTPCSHPHLGRYHRHRWWGLCFCNAPCITGTIRIIGDDSWYDATVQSRVQALASQDPTVRDEFRQRIMIDHDPTWWQTFWPRVGVPSAPREQAP